MKREETVKVRVHSGEVRLLEKLKKITDWNASQIIREALKMFAAAKGVQ